MIYYVYNESRISKTRANFLRNALCQFAKDLTVADRYSWDIKGIFYVNTEEENCPVHYDLAESEIGKVIRSLGKEINPTIHYIFEPFEKVITRKDRETWKCDFFSHMDHGSYVTMSGLYACAILPYKDHEDWLGTDKDISLA